LRNRVAIRYVVGGDLRFISHHDTLRLFERALSRAGLPVRFSEGFNPRPRMTVALPRSVGLASSDELLVIELSEPMEGSQVAARLAAVMPGGMEVLSAEVLAEGDRRLPCEATYELLIDGTSPAELAERTAGLLAQQRLDVTRTEPRTGKKKVVDIRPYIVTVDVVDRLLSWTQSITPTGTVRPDEMLAALGLSASDHLHRLHRCRVRYVP
jgi:radical SAM-linked protein